MEDKIDLKVIKEALTLINDESLTSIPNLYRSVINVAIEDLKNIIQIIEESETITKIIPCTLFSNQVTYEKGEHSADIFNLLSAYTYGYFVNKKEINRIVKNYNFK